MTAEQGTKFKVIRYNASMADKWNEFVANAKQGTFLFDRAYMDYHSDRFNDCSLVILHKGHICALMPANVTGNMLWSHQGLTYGGLITGKKATTGDVCEMFKTMNAYLSQAGITKVVYKAMPWIYHQLPAEEDLYALTNICHARLFVRHISSTIVIDRKLRFIESRKSGIRKAKREGIAVGESDNLEAFWNILNDNLNNKYGSKPVHTLAELQLLKSRFPDYIRLFMSSSRDGKPLGGTLVFETPQVIHTQYISASPEGKAVGALDLLFDYVINKVYDDRVKYPNIKYFDFGKSSDGDGHELNGNLIFQKEGFGGRGVCYDWYEYDL